MGSLPESGAEYNVRHLETQCCNLNGMAMEEWYNMALTERTWKVAAMLLPIIIGSLQARQSAAELARVKHA